MNRQLMSLGRGRPVEEMGVHADKSHQILKLEKDYSDLEFIIKQRNATHQVNKDMLEKTLQQLQEQRMELLNLQSKIGGSEYNISRERELRKELQEITAEISQLHDRITELVNSPFVKSAEGRLNYIKKLQEKETQLSELEKEHKDMTEEAEKYEFENRQLTEEIQNLKDEIKRLKGILEELKSGFSKETAGKLLSAKTPEEFRLIMETMVREGTLPAWAKVNFLPQRPKEDLENPEFLLYEIERLTLEKGQLAAELQKTQELRDAKGMIDAARMSVDRKISELERLLSYAHPRGHLQPEEAKEFSAGKYRKVATFKAADVDALTEFSESQPEELPPKTNILDLLIIDAIYYDKPLAEALRLSQEEVAQFTTLAEVDFYNHDGKYTPSRPGLTPKYVLQVAFQVDIDDAFLKHMQEGDIEVTLIHINEAMPQPFGRALLPLRDLADKIMMSSGSVPVVTKAATITALDPELGAEQKVVGQLRYKMRMRLDLQRDLKEYRDRNEHQAAARTSTLSAIVPTEARTYTIRILRCEHIRMKDTSKVLAPFVYYSFYKFWHTTKTMAGTDPAFDDIRTFDVTMSTNFIEYLQSAPMEIVVFNDDKTQQTRMREAAQGPPGEIIGRTHIKLSDLLDQREYEKKYVEDLKDVNERSVVGRIELWIMWNVKRTDA
eukprot:TRINITY_DN9393_c0_g1_i4.p1 TRINITY_DN9393_c0_g1~~TRINITY_DN9393_c0_g1_i4.p1  ORF type:complete len:667 (-),score=245.31 TRINITY_DN9393_c0_g1_i4:74-2074(-)